MIRKTVVFTVTAAVVDEVIVVGSRENLPASFATKGRLYTERIVKIMS